MFAKTVAETLAEMFAKAFAEIIIETLAKTLLLAIQEIPRSLVAPSTEGPADSPKWMRLVSMSVASITW